MGTVGNGDDLDLKYSEGAWQTNSRYSIFLGRSSSGPKRQPMKKLNTGLNTFHLYEILAFLALRGSTQDDIPDINPWNLFLKVLKTHSTIYSTSND